MTAEEADRIERLTEKVQKYHDEVLKLSGQLEKVVSNTEIEMRGFRKVCDERHGIRPQGKFERLEQQEREHYGSWQKLMGAGAAIGVCLSAIVGLIIWALGGG